MTGLLTRSPSPRPGGGRGSTGGPPPGKAGARRPPSATGARELSTTLVLASEVALGGVTLAAALGLGRLFSDWAFAVPVAIAVIVGHTTAIVGRRLGLGPVGAGLLSAAGLVAVVAWVVEPHTTTLGLPGRATWEAVTTDLADAWARFGEVKAPTATTRGFVLGGVLGAWIVATTADAFAFRLRARFEAVAPSFTLFVFVAILAPGPAGGGRGRLAAASAYLAAILGFLLVSEVARRSAWIPWFGHRGRAGAVALLRRGGVLAVSAIVVAVVAGPNLPGASAPGTLGWRDDTGGDRSRTTVSPLVDIRGRLVDQSNVELFTVAASTPAYWRLTSLETFDGTIWSSLSTYEPAREALESDHPTSGREDTSTQEFTIGPLASIWLPAAFRPVRVTGLDGVRHDPGSASLLTGEDTSDGLRYTVESALPRFTAEALAGAGSAVPDDIEDPYLELPDEFPAEVRTTAEEVVGAAGPDATPYEQALALQNWFRDTFTYDVDVAPGHGVDAIGQFLEARRGYCEQFSGTYAAMARAVGLPARVAVGFTPGTLGGDGRYHVAGRDAHAWPEVHLAGFGWVAFEPTPGRDIPGGAAYTGQAPDGGPSTEQPVTPTTAVTGPSDVAVPDDELDRPETTPDPLTPPGDTGAPGRVGSTLLLILAVNGAYVGLVMGARRWVRSRRRARATTPSLRVLVAWTEAEEALALAGVARAPAETPAEYVARVAAAGFPPPVVTPLAALAEETAVAGFAPAGAGGTGAERAASAAAAVEGALRAQAGWRERVRWTVDPRPLLRHAGAQGRAWWTARWGGRAPEPGPDGGWDPDAGDPEAGDPDAGDREPQPVR